MWHYEIRFHSPLTSVGVVHSIRPSQAMWWTHAPTFNKWKKKKKILHILTHGAMRECGLTYLTACINDKIRDIREMDVTIRSAIWTTTIRSLGFRDTREWVMLWGLILGSLRCTCWHPPAFLYWIGVYSMISSQMIGSFPAVLNFSRFICD